MPSFWGGIANGLTQAVTGYDEGANIQRQQLIAQKAKSDALALQQAKDARETAKDASDAEFKRQEMITKGYHAGTTTVTPDDPTADPAADPSAPPIASSLAPLLTASALQRGKATGNSPFTSDAISQAGGTLGTPMSSSDPLAAGSVAPGSLGKIPRYTVTTTPEGFTDPSIAKEQAKLTAETAERTGREAADRNRKIQTMTGQLDGEGKAIDAGRAAAMVDSPQMASMYTKVPAPAPTAHFTTVTTTDPVTQEQTVSRFNTQTGEVTPTGTLARLGGGGVGGGGSVTAQMKKAMLAAALTEARVADKRMRAQEAKWLHRGSTIDPISQVAGTLSNNLANTHSVMGALTQAGAMAGLGAVDPEYAQYNKDAQAMGRAESMVMPRGGNESMTRANAVLAAVGTGASPAMIRAAQMTRQSLFGSAGGLVQAMPASDRAKMEHGVAAIIAADGGVAGGGDTPSKPSLTARAGQLRAKGMSKAAAAAQLRTEGYDLNAPE
jgi:hypothetical protein